MQPMKRKNRYCGMAKWGKTQSFLYENGVRGFEGSSVLISTPFIGRSSSWSPVFTVPGKGRHAHSSGSPSGYGNDVEK
jgi:hypothetical protein